jgi:hypothetical protein
MSDVRILAHTAGGGTVLVTVEGDELPSGPHEPALYRPVRVYHVDRDELSEPVWIGSALKVLGGYLEELMLEPAEAERVLARITELAGRAR